MKWWMPWLRAKEKDKPQAELVYIYSDWWQDELGNCFTRSGKMDDYSKEKETFMEGLRRGILEGILRAGTGYQAKASAPEDCWQEYQASKECQKGDYMINQRTGGVHQVIDAPQPMLNRTPQKFITEWKK